MKRATAARPRSSRKTTARSHRRYFLRTHTPRGTRHVVFDHLVNEGALHAARYNRKAVGLPGSPGRHPRSRPFHACLEPVDPGGVLAFLAPRSRRTKRCLPRNAHGEWLGAPIRAAGRCSRLPKDRRVDSTCAASRTRRGPPCQISHVRGHSLSPDRGPLQSVVPTARRGFVLQILDYAGQSDCTPVRKSSWMRWSTLIM